MNEEYTVDSMALESAADDAQQAPEQAEGGSPAQENQVLALSELLDAGAEGAEAPQDTQAESGQARSEPPISGGIKGRLLASEQKGHQKGYEEGKAAAEAAWQAERAQYEARLAKLEEYEINEAAQQIAQENNCSIELAKRIARLERGLPAQAAAPAETQPQPPQLRPQPRGADGRFISQGQQAVNERARALYDQAQTIQKATGMDVLAIFNQDESVRLKVSSGEWDFADVAKAYAGQKPQRATPPAIRHPGGSGFAARTFADMTDDQLDEINRRLEEGYVIDMRR